jgi:DDE family transposase
VDALVRDAHAALEVLDGHELDGPAAEAAELLGLVAGQDVEAGEDGVFRIARKVARDRLISTVDVQARHGHKSRARTFDGYKTHVNVDPDDELITNVAVTAANTPDRDVIDELLNEPGADQPATDTDDRTADAEPATDGPGADADTDTGTDGGSGSKDFEVYGDSAYADGATLHEQTQRGHDMRTKVPPVRNANGFSKDQFRIDLPAGTVTCPAHHTVAIRDGRRHRSARFGPLCRSCPLRAACTKARGGRVISIHPHEAALQHAKARQKDPAWQPAYRQHRPVVERKISHFSRRPLGRSQGSLPRICPHIDGHPDPGQRHQSCPTGHSGAAPGHQRLGNGLSQTPPQAAPLTAPLAGCTGKPPHLRHYISSVLAQGHGDGAAARVCLVENA